MSTTGRSVRDYVACYSLWLATVVVGLLDLAVARMWLREGYVQLGLNPWGFAAATNFGLVIFAMVWLGGILYAESYYRDGIAKGRLWQRFKVISAVQVVPLVLTLLIILSQRLGF